MYSLEEEEDSSTGMLLGEEGWGTMRGMSSTTMFVSSCVGSILACQVLQVSSGVLDNGQLQQEASLTSGIQFRLVFSLVSSFNQCVEVIVLWENTKSRPVRYSKKKSGTEHLLRTLRERNKAE